MLSIDWLLSDTNQEEAKKALLSKNRSPGPDGINVSEFIETWKHSGFQLEQQIREGNYNFSIVKQFDKSKNDGKIRQISSINIQDKYIDRLIFQMLKKEFENIWVEQNYSFQKGKSIVDAISYTCDLINSGKNILIEIDIAKCFDSINHNILLNTLRNHCSDDFMFLLLKDSIKRKVFYDDKLFTVNAGLIQGSSVSPVLCNYYLHSLDKFISNKNWYWFRYVDNIYIFVDNQTIANEVYSSIKYELSESLHLQINTRKSGVFNTENKRILGYDIYKSDGITKFCKHDYKKRKVYSQWHKSALSYSKGEYHLINDGILTKKDFSLLFDNDDFRYVIPVEVTNQINVFSNITVSASARNYLSVHNIKLSFFNRYGNYCGAYIPAYHKGEAKTFLSQCTLYNDINERLKVAKKFEIAGIHNMRSNIRYYLKKFNKEELTAINKFLSETAVEINEGKTVDDLLLIEARARQKYYSAFKLIIRNLDFCFSIRTKRPPKDEVNAMISFGNTILYNKILQLIYKTSLDPKIGVVHATNRRTASLNLDFADIFKPVIVDRIILSLINRHEIKSISHFTKFENGAVYLNNEGKSIFIKKFDNKLASSHTYKGKKTTYGKLLEDQVRDFQNFLKGISKYNAYKYY